MNRNIAVFCSLFACTTANASEILPLEAFGRLPMIESLKLSPNGKHLAILRNSDGNTFLISQTLGEKNFTPVVQTDNKDMQIRWFEWANDDRLLVSARGTIYINGKVNAQVTRLTAFGRTGGEGKLLAKPRAGFKDPGDHVSQFQDEIIDYLPEDHDHVLMAIDAEQPTYPSVYRVNVYDGGKELIKRWRAPVREWITDQQGRVRVGSGLSETELQIFVRDADKDEWRAAWKFDALQQPGIEPIGFGIDPNWLYVSANHQGRSALFKVDLRDPQLKQQLIVADAKHDVHGRLLHSPKTHDAVGIYLSGSRGNHLWFDAGYKVLQQAIDRALPDTHNEIVSISNDEQRYIVRSYNSTQPGTYYLGDRGQKRIDYIADDYPLLVKTQLPMPKVIQIKTGDGATLEGILTVPASSSGTNLPTVIIPQSGLGDRFDTSFNYITAFLVARGYAVLGINTRGAAGYGQEFKNAGLRTMGTLMPSDIADATRWLIAQKIADKQRIALFGEGFGGYAVLMSAARNPDLYSAVASLDAVTNLGTFINRAINFTNNDLTREMISTKPADLHDMSPTSHARAIRAALLLVHGDNDTYIPHTHSEQMAAAMSNSDAAHELHLLEDEDSRLHLEKNRIRFLQLIEAFLAKHVANPAVAQN